MPQFRSRGHGRNRESYPLHSGVRVHSHPSQTLIYPSAGIRHEGTLVKHGYQLGEGEDKRHDALRKAVHADGYEKTQQRLTALQVVNKGHKKNHAKIIADQEWLRKHTWTRAMDDTAGGARFENKEGRVVTDTIPEGDIRQWKFP